MIDFVQTKDVNWDQVRGFLETARRANHWSNFGPVSLAFERDIEAYLRLAPDLKAICCASGTQGLFVLIQLHQCLARRPLHWVVSSFGFCCTVQGPLHQAIVVDCDWEGFLNFANIDSQPCDGLVVTNTFGLKQSLDAFRQYCTEKGLILVCDSAMALDSAQHGPNEVISFHHTKPWGFGEGGCVIVNADHEQLVRSLINLGRMPVEGMAFGEILPWSTNAKLSEVSSAFLAQHFARMPQLSCLCRVQYSRIAHIARAEGFRLLSGTEVFAGTPPLVALLAPRPIHDLNNSHVRLLKHYMPLSETPVAAKLYAHVLLVPCHPEMTRLSDCELRQCFLELRDRCCQ